jgi:uncharacterized membrane protein
MYLWLKLIHILAVVLFLGNIITGVFWHRHAARTRDPKILAHTADGLTKSDRLFTIPGVLLIVLAGVAAAMQGNFPILRTPWILWTLILFSISGFAFMARVAPLQRKLHTLADAGTKGGAFDYAAYHRVANQWEFWGAIATLAPLVGLALMVLKPT